MDYPIFTLNNLTTANNSAPASGLTKAISCRNVRCSVKACLENCFLPDKCHNLWDIGFNEECAAGCTFETPVK